MAADASKLLVVAALPVVAVAVAVLPAGQVLAVLFAVTTAVLLPRRSRGVLAVNAMVFGLAFLALPVELAPGTVLVYRAVGVALVVIAPIVYVAATR